MNVASRPPSVAWEPVVVPAGTGCVIWVWYKPGGAAWDLLVQVPPETQHALGPQVTMRFLLSSLSVAAENVDFWTLQGASFASQRGANSLLDHPLPPPGTWGDPQVLIRLHPLPPVPAPGPPPAQVVAPVMPQTPVSSMTSPPPMNASTEGIFAGFEADWNALLQLEAQLSSARKQLGSLQGQLQSLNRDLNPEERLAADNQDKKDWTDTRRWLRDSLALVSRYIREHDIGMVSAAGNRNRFEQIYTKHIVPRRPFAGQETLHHEFEQHRKMAQNLLVQMQSTQQNASRDGVNRARQVLNRIGGKARKAKEKRGTR